MILSILRGIFILLAATVTASYIVGSQEGQGLDFLHVVAMMSIALGIAGLVIAADALTPHKKLSALSGVLLGLIAGLLAAFALGFVVDFITVLKAPEVTIPAPQPPRLVERGDADGRPLSALPEVASVGPATSRPAATQPRSAVPSTQYEMQKREYDRQVKVRQSFLNLMQGVKIWIGLITCYMGISLVLQTKGDFRFIVPYVEFAKEIRGTRPILLDTSVIIDGRIVDIVQTHLLQVGLIVPKFVLQELQTIADSGDKLKRARGRRGLDIMHKLQQDPGVSISIDETDVEETTVDQKLMVLAGQINARLMTNDFNLNKLATVRGLTVINLNDLAAALRPVVLPGETMHIKVLKPGEGSGQGVGYLDDGTMVVVEGARGLVGQEIDLTVTSMLQTSAGRMIFGRLSPADASAAPARGK